MLTCRQSSEQFYEQMAIATKGMHEQELKALISAQSQCRHEVDAGLEVNAGLALCMQPSFGKASLPFVACVDACDLCSCVYVE